ncbi:MAG: hypothetical protein OEQ12_04320 [Nitrosopumilus sp.]|nr:hypothetical protein [Nitrosopumilus sp.]
MGLSKILVYSAFAGFSITLAQQSGGESTGLGVSSVVSTLLPSFADPQIQSAIILGSIAMTILSIYGTAKFLVHIYDNRLVGIVTAILGFLGSISIFSAQEGSNYIFLGVGAWIVGTVLVVSQRGKKISD